jgi:hypothetical protein
MHFVFTSVFEILKGKPFSSQANQERRLRGQRFSFKNLQAAAEEDLELTPTSSYVYPIRPPIV